MKMLLEDKVYDIPSDLLMSWIAMTPALSEQLRNHWTAFRESRFPGRKAFTRDEYVALVDEYSSSARDEEYCKIMLDAMLDLKKAMKEDFEDYRIDMSREEMEEIANNPDFPSYTSSEPVKIPINGDT